MDRKELEFAVSEIRSCGEMLLGAAERLVRAFEESPAETIAPQEESLTIEDVRRVLAQKSREGFTAEIRTLLEKHGADRLSNIAPEQYAALLKEAEKIGT
mgnify:CR=1 FL=1